MELSDEASNKPIKTKFDDLILDPTYQSKKITQE